MITTIDRADAVRRIAGHLADRDAYVITAPPDVIEDLGHALDDVPSWTAYVDNGTPLLLCTSQAAALLITHALISTAVVLVVPKTVAATTLTEALGQEVPADGSRDIVVLASPDSPAGPVMWPLLFVDALAVVDPRAAAQLRANHLGNLS